VQLSERNAFSIGVPPPLAGEALGHFGTAAALHAYLRAAMPRYAPGTLSEESYWDVTAFLLELSGKLPPGLTLSPENAESIRLR
jgi:mono/diheme cytochrome c family protein